MSMTELTYEQTKELEANVAITKKAEELYADFMRYALLSPRTFKNGRFCVWSDSHNATYVAVDKDRFTFVCEFLHENYSTPITPGSLFSQIKAEYRGIDHLRSYVNTSKQKASA